MRFEPVYLSDHVLDPALFIIYTIMIGGMVCFLNIHLTRCSGLTVLTCLIFPIVLVVNREVFSVSLISSKKCNTHFTVFVHYHTSADNLVWFGQDIGECFYLFNFFFMIRRLEQFPTLDWHFSISIPSNWCSISVNLVITCFIFWSFRRSSFYYFDDDKSSARHCDTQKFFHSF